MRGGRLRINSIARGEDVGDGMWPLLEWKCGGGQEAGRGGEGGYALEGVGCCCGALGVVSLGGARRVGHRDGLPR